MLKRAKQPMAEFVKDALNTHNLMDAYRARPDYQQNDYLSWIQSAKQKETKDKRLAQMIDELRRGGVYMKMDHPASKK